MDNYSVKFNRNDLALVPGADLFNHQFNNLPSREIKIFKVARRNLSIITSSEYSSKEITVQLEVCAASRALSESILTNLKALVQPQNAPLVVSQGGKDVEYTATMNEFNIRWDSYKAYVDITFIASNPIGREQQSQTLFNINGNTLARASQTFNVQGSATAFPIISVTITAVTGGASKQILIENGRTGQGIRINRTFTAGDIIVVDSLNLQVTVNGLQIDFDGMFPVWPSGSQQAVYGDNFTTRNVDINATYNPRLV